MFFDFEFGGQDDEGNFIVEAIGQQIWLETDSFVPKEWDDWYALTPEMKKSYIDQAWELLMGDRDE